MESCAIYATGWSNLPVSISSILANRIFHQEYLGISCLMYVCVTVALIAGLACLWWLQRREICQVTSIVVPPILSIVRMVGYMSYFAHIVTSTGLPYYSVAPLVLFAISDILASRQRFVATAETSGDQRSPNISHCRQNGPEAVLRDRALSSGASLSPATSRVLTARRRFISTPIDESTTTRIHRTRKSSIANPGFKTTASTKELWDTSFALLLYNLAKSRKGSPQEGVSHSQ